jgi:predicted patatin/cPLA2 family phospholipase|tara:strand:- start:102 stop:308 length:207 start_codon:yes stop_codon:yes gene_type:complete
MAKENKETTSTIEMKWTWVAHMASLIKFIEMGNDDNKQFAYDELMKLAAQLDVTNPIKQEQDEEVKAK